MRRTLLPFTISACLAVGLASCAAPVRAIPADRPADFSMLVTVFPSDAAETASWLRPARYAVEPDGYLRAETGAGVAKPGFPPIARRLEPSQIDRLYTLAQQLRDEDGTIVPGVEIYKPPAGERVALLEIDAAGHDVATVHNLGNGTPAAPLIQELAHLAWLDR
ncbi:MAG: hypothetical protein H6810_02630 [Phycisphaeraceae bacterium]|nr:MAG: hypothetical protein H6810_02630 [Phycisphaeraceae bacterium]